MQTVDILIGVFATIAVVGSVVGAVLYEPPTGGVDYLVTYPTSTETLRAESVTTAGGGPGGSTQEYELTHDVQLANLTGLTFSISVQSSAPGGLTGVRTGALAISVTVIDPDGVERATEEASISQTGTSVDFEVEVTDINPIPDETVISAASSEDAGRQANESAPAHAGHGEWVLQFELAYPGPTPETGSLTSTPTARYYTASVERDTPDISPTV